MIDDIADRLSATKGRVYHYYRKKGDVFLDVHRRALEIMFAEVEPLSQLPRMRSSTSSLRARSLRSSRGRQMSDGEHA